MWLSDSPTYEFLSEKNLVIFIRRRMKNSYNFRKYYLLGSLNGRLK